MAEMVNISDEKVSVEIALMAGQPPMVIELEPGAVHNFMDGYSTPVKGAGANTLPPILSRKYQRNGAPFVVPKDEEHEARAKYAAAQKEAVGKMRGTPQAVANALMAENAELRARLARAENGAKAKK